jgi:hypothetical protein
VDKSQGLSVLLHNTEPPGTIRRIRGFVYSTLNLVLDDLDYFVVNCGRDGNIPLHPWRMRDSCDPDRREILLLKPTALAGIPYECEFVLANNPLQQLQFFGPKPLRGVEIECICTFLRITDSGDEWWRMNGKVA